MLCIPSTPSEAISSDLIDSNSIDFDWCIINRLFDIFFIFYWLFFCCCCSWILLLLVDGLLLSCCIHRHRRRRICNCRELPQRRVYCWFTCFAGFFKWNGFFSCSDGLRSMQHLATWKEIKWKSNPSALLRPYGALRLPPQLIGASISIVSPIKCLQRSV